MILLTSPVQVGNLILKNRLVMPPMATSKAENGKVTPDLIRYYQEKSDGGALGLIIMEHSFISAEGQASANQTSISSDEDLAGLRELTAAIHANGSPVFAQLNHAGSAAKEEVTGYVPLAPSALKHPKAKDDRLPKAMTAQDLEKVIADFKEAARRAQAAGFDGVEIHSAHGYLLNQFYSPLTNHRMDEYGGTLENRIRLHCQIIEAIRSQVGAEYPRALRLGACEGLANGSTVEDAVSACVQFEKAGVDLIDITGGLGGYVRPGHSEQGYFQDFSAAVKQAVSIPVLLTGGITEAAAAEALLQNGKADLIGVGRALLKDSDWAKNAVCAVQ